MKFGNLVALLLMAICSSTVAQKIKLVAGDLKPLQGQKGIQIHFLYDSMVVGEESEKAYVQKLEDRWNAEEAGKGDEWKKKWFDARTNLYEPTFRYCFSKESGISTKSEGDAYRIVFKTTLSEPGFNVPGIAAQLSRIDAEATLVKTEDPTNVLAKITLSKFKSKSVSGGDFGVESRLQEAYKAAATALGQFIKTQAIKSK